MRKFMLHFEGVVVLLTLLIVSLFVIYQLSVQSEQKDFAIEITTQEELTTSEKITIAQVEETTAQPNYDTLTSIITANLTKSEQTQYVQALISNQYNNQYLSNQDDFVTMMKAAKLDIEENSYLFLPQNPAQFTKSTSNQLDVPLLLQKDQHWRKSSYGSNDTDQLGENGCAILTLAMIDSYYNRKIVEPKEILKWSGSDYFVEDQGTSWSIFHTFAEQFGYHFENFGNDFHRAMAALDEGRVVIASVVPGYFTDNGHILIIRGYENNKVFVNDPNDDVNKMFSLQGIDESIFLAEGINYWTIYK